ncbi:MAG: hypothetical protein JXA33_19415 [Anaerolineae bacterium]|nr:hypothetical protein [Anaerolineae bacterium]
MPLNFSGDEVNTDTHIERTPAPDLPTRNPDINGAVTRIIDNSLFIGTDNVTFSITHDEQGASQHSINYTGPEMEVLVTHNTTIYCDTNWQEIFTYSQEQGTLQQEIAPCTLADIEAQGGCLSVWGTQRGDRLIAEILLYTGF